VCSKHGTWFDADELPQVLEFVQTGGLVRERARELERERLARAHDREHVGGGPERPVAFDSLTISGEHSSLASDYWASWSTCLTHHDPKKH